MRDFEKKHWIQVVPVVVSVLAVIFAWQAGSAFCGSKKPAKASQTLAPNFTLDALNGGTKSLKDYRGKVVLVDFWSIKCPPCRRAVPHLVTLYNKYKDQGFVALGVSFDRKDMEDLKSFVSEFDVDYPILLGTMDVARAYGVRSIPSMFLLDKQGHIRLHRIGFNEEIGNEIETELKTLLKEK